MVGEINTDGIPAFIGVALVIAGLVYWAVKSQKKRRRNIIIVTVAVVWFWMLIIGGTFYPGGNDYPKLPPDAFERACTYAASIDANHPPTPAGTAQMAKNAAESGDTTLIVDVELIQRAWAAGTVQDLAMDFLVMHNDCLTQ